LSLISRGENERSAVVTVKKREGEIGGKEGSSNPWQEKEKCRKLRPI